MTTARFRDYRLHEEVSVGFTGGPEWLTDVVVAAEREERNQRRSRPKWRFNAQTGVFEQEAARALTSHLLCVAVGRAYAFPFKDWTDFLVEEPEVFGTGGGTDGETDFPLTLVYSLGSFSFSRIIRLPVLATVQIYVDGDPITSGYTVTRPGGVVFDSPPDEGAELAWSGEFDVPVRLEADYNPSRVIASNPLLQFENLGMIEDLEV